MIKIIKKPYFLWTLFFVNLIGSIYGFYWYHQQLLETQGILKLFVPDSPTASLLFTLALFMMLTKKPKPLLSLIACGWLIKYGLWAVIINTHYYFIGGNYTFTNFHLTLSHLGMAAEGFLFINDIVINKYHLISLISLMIISDILDYKLGIHPWLFAQSQLKAAAFSVAVLTSLISLYCIWLYKKRY
ncbi:DUF1405 domain-containing protein [Tepidanaerobacter sp. GT38]|uniref:DUF1405 domain-containing protein n=1 Tax=Tepidanaerobacter sp. GT38 TaxID=2722793 RepID=UPI001F31581F|nr:DUF1405 domain-containing protein [Tepidanaerobacter sp. GT38]MCG1011362.1 DUF1405 domain-containing protein [Tepidanaerobacter sp. GT38]